MDDRAEWERRRREWEPTVEAGDAERYADLVTEDVVWLPPGRPPVVGRAAFREWLAPFLGGYSYRFSTSDVRARVADDRAMERGRFRSVMTPVGGGDAMAHDGTYVVLWRRDADGRWRIERYVDDTSLSAPGEGAR